MSSNFKVGAISNTTPNKKNKFNKKQKSPKSQEGNTVTKTNIVKEELAEQQIDVKPAVLKRKAPESENETIEVTKAETPGKKQGKRLKKANPIAKAEAPVELAAPEPEAETKKANSRSKKAIKDDQANQEKLSRTVFIGNLPAGFGLKDLKKVLSQYGNVATIRVRGVAPAKENLSKKVAFLSKQINPNKKTVNAYVVYKSIDSVQKATSLNGTEFEGHVIQVDRVVENPIYENAQSVFLGNLSFKTTDDELREFFKDCGEITSVRLVRDSQTGIGKGFGYVNFRDKDGVVLALEKNGQKFNEREIRVQSYKYNLSQKPSKGQKSSKFQKPSNSPISPRRAKPGNNEKPNHGGMKSQPKRNGGQAKEFKGELASKKLLNKKSIKNRIKASKVNKQKKKISEILSK